MNIRFFLLIALLLCLNVNNTYAANQNKVNKHANLFKILSPNNQLHVEFMLDSGVPKYRLLKQADEVVSWSRLGFKFKEQPALLDGFKIKTNQQKIVKEEWSPVWGESSKVSSHYREGSFLLKEVNGLERQLTLYFRVFNDGIGFRYEFPQQANLQQFAITDEVTEFNLSTANAIENNKDLAKGISAWWTPANFDSYEALYQHTLVSAMPAVNTPVTLKINPHTYLSIHEAALTDYAGMTLAKDDNNPLMLTADLVPWPDGIKVKGTTPFKSPWRTIQVANSAAELINSNLIVNLNELNVIEDTSWIKPMKYIGIWWGMHMREYTWEAGPKHGATTENTLRYMDFAKDNGIGGVLVEGWNRGWETWHSGNNVQDFTQAYDDFDIARITAYGKKHNVSLIGHHETGGNIPLYEAQMEQAFELYESLGVSAIKTGYAGKMRPEGLYHHSQPMVNHYRKVLELSAKSRIMLNAHEPIKPTGLRRTYPNMMTREGGRGMEWNGWSEGNSPEHTVTLPFTRLLAGPMDYTPGIFNLLFDPQQQYRVHTTLAKQLAMFVTLYSPMQMAADMIENYIDQPAFEFIKEVPTTWDETQVLEGEIGDYIGMARRADKRWFIGAMTDEQPRTLTVTLDFIDDDTKYAARIFADDTAVDFYDHPTAIRIDTVQVKKGDVLNIALASGGGQAIYLTPITTEEPSHQSTNRLEKALTVKQHNSRARANSIIFKQGRSYGEVKTVQHLAVNKKITTLLPYDKHYTGGGEQALNDGLLGGADYKTLWQGYRQQHLDVVIDLEQKQTVSSIEIGFLQSVLHSILLPTDVEFFVSSNGEDYTLLDSQHYHTQEHVPDYQQKRFTATFKPQTIRYIRVKAKNLINLPEWHIRAGQETFIFADEIVVK